MNAAAARTGGWRPLFRADWTRFVFLHYSLPPEALAPYTPLELDCRGGRAFVSLVFFRFDRMRPACLPAGLGALLLRPASNNWFLNVRTYVRGEAGPGIQFLVEWMDNPLSRHLGPLLYGLPYRTGEFSCADRAPGHETELSVTDAETRESLRVSLVAGGGGEHPVDPLSLDGFLLEKYTAYTHQQGVSRFFHISHPHWAVAAGKLRSMDDQLIRNHCPWFAQATLQAVHSSTGYRDVAMGFPHRLGRNRPGHFPAPFAPPTGG